MSKRQRQERLELCLSTAEMRELRRLAKKSEFSRAEVLRYLLMAPGAEEYLDELPREEKRVRS